MQAITATKTYRHLKVGYFRKRHEDRKTKSRAAIACMPP